MSNKSTSAQNPARRGPKAHWMQFLNIFLQNNGFPIVFSVRNSFSASDIAGHRDTDLSFYHVSGLSVSIHPSLSFHAVVSRPRKILLIFSLGPAIPSSYSFRPRVPISNSLGNPFSGRCKVNGGI